MSREVIAGGQSDHEGWIAARVVSGRLWPLRHLGFGEHVLVLRVTGDEAVLCPRIRDDELETRECRVDGDEGSRAVVVLARSDRALPLAHAEYGRRALLLDRD